MKDNTKINVAKVLAIGTIVSIILIPFTNGWSSIPLIIFGGAVFIWINTTL
jgi:hypothetical protein